MQINSHTATHIFFWSAVSLLLMVNVGLIFWHMWPGHPNQREDNTVPGRVVSIDNNILVTSDPRGNLKSFNISSSTKFILGKEEVSPDYLKPDIPVLVQVDSADDTQIVEVRLMTDKSNHKFLK